MFYEFERKVRKSFTSLLPYESFLEESILANKNNTLQTSFIFRGADLDSSTDDELEVITLRLNNVLKRLDGNWAIFVDTIREKSKKYSYKMGINKIPTQILEIERANFFKSGHHFENKYIITFVYFLKTDNFKKVSKLFYKETQEEEVKSNIEEEIKQYKQEINNIYALFSTVFKEIRIMSSEEMVTFYHNCISDTKMEVVRIPPNNRLLDNYISDCPLVGGLEPKAGKEYINIISLYNFPNVSTPSLFDRLNRIDVEYRFSTRYISLDKIDGNNILEKFMREWNAKKTSLKNMIREIMTKEKKADDEFAANMEREVKEIKENLDADNIGLGFYTFCIIVKDENKIELEKKSSKIKNILNGLGFTAEIESGNALDAYVASIPGNIVCNCRKPPMPTINLADLLPTSSVWAGDEYNKHLNEAALLYTQTTGNTPFRLNLHYGDVAHTLIVGPTGAGKSTLLATLEAHYTKYTNSQVINFDKGGSTRILTQGMGGKFYDLGADNIRFQPLRNVDKEKEWCQSWIGEILTVNENVTLDPIRKSYISNALDSVANLPIQNRTLGAFVSFLGGQDNHLKQALASYHGAGIYAKYFDGNSDFLEDNDFITFEMEQIANNKNAIVPTLSYLFHKLEIEKFTGRPTLLTLDECWLFLDNPIFSAKIREWLKVLRKKNVGVIFATQSLADIANSNILSAVLDSCYSRIYLPNASANEQKDLYKIFGLNETEIQILRNAIPKRQYYYKNPNGSRLFELALSGLELAYVAASSPEDQKMCKELANLSNEEFNINWLNYKGYDGKVILENLKNGVLENE